tara:strand:+ start:14577 stop:14801 length:225 start_codon:yes stop_codon:yes gene_type:complete
MEDKINIIKRQTDYNEETIIEKLKQYDNDIEKIILEYNGLNYDGDNQEKKEITTNQKIFKAIRDNMNDLTSKKI